MLLAARTDVVALNFFFDTLLFCGAILLLANSIDKNQRGFSAEIILSTRGRGACHVAGTASPTTVQQLEHWRLTSG
jgi:hypothetical protein